MKTLNIVMLACVISTSVLFFSSCTPPPEDPTAEQIQLKKLQAKTWLIQSVKINGVDETILFDGMTLTFTKDSFTASNGSTVWPSTGTWEFTDGNATTILRGDQVSVAIEALTESDLRLSLTWSETAFGPGRVNSISGVHVFDFN